MAEIQIYDMATNAAPDDGDFFEQDIVDTSLPAGRNNKKISLGATADFIAKTHNYTSDLQTTNKTIVGAINEVLNDGTSVSVTNVLPATDTTKRVATITVDGVAKDVNADDADAILRQAFGEHTVTGNPVTFDAFLGLEVPSECKVTMNPIQDLHGQSAPYPAGGGKNLAKPYVFSGSIVAYDGKGNVTVNGTTTGAAYAPATSQAISGGFLFPLQAGTYKPSTEKALPDGIQINVCSQDNVNLSNGGSFTLTESTNVYVRVVISQAGTYNWTSGLMLEAGSTTTAYAPYENICPISGRDSVTVTRTAGEDVETHTHTYASTVYGGVDDFVSGEGNSTYATVDLGTLTWKKSGSSANTFIASLSANSYKYTSATKFLSSHYKFIGYKTGSSGMSTADNCTFAYFYTGTGTSREVYFKNTDYDDATSFKTAMLGVQLCYELATPTQITNTHEDISLLKGVNVVSTDGDSIELKYSADIKAYIDSKLNA